MITIQCCSARDVAQGHNISADSRDSFGDQGVGTWFRDKHDANTIESISVGIAAF
ncbi:MAG: hypothetical protein IH987_02015 [Planctomycetes bacterium]|nr:hypothetical protein [Planctomycetota bacterium]